MYARGDGAIGDELKSVKLLDFSEWKELNKDLRLVDADYTAREQSLAFVWSRMRVVNDELYESKAKVLQLSFEDFLEALVHVATMKALPDDEQIYDYDCEDAGEFLIKMRGDPAAWQRFVAENTPEFGAPLNQPIYKLVEHLCHYLVRTVAHIVASAGDARKSVKDLNSMTLDNVKYFQKLARRGGGARH